MLRRMLLLTSIAVMVALAGCRHKCCKLSQRDEFIPPSSVGPRNPMLLPPTTVPTTPAPAIPGPAVPEPGPSFFQPPAVTTPDGGPKVLFPDPLPGGKSSRPAQPGVSFLQPPVKATTEPPRAANTNAALPTYVKVKEGLYAGGKPTLDGFDALKKAGFRAVIYLHASGANVNAVKDMASTRGLQFIAIETTPETLADASKEFDRAATDRLNRPAYVFGDDATRAGAVWYLHFRNVDTQDNDVARLRAKPLGLNEQSEEGKAFAVAIQRVLEQR